MGKTKKTKTGAGSDEEARPEAASEPIHEESENQPMSEANDTKARHKPGDTISVGGQDVTFEAERQLGTSASSGISSGVYSIVSVILMPGNRKVYRAVVGDVLYPIREYGTPNEVISKIRGESKEPRKPRKTAVAKTISHTSDEGPSITLTDAAAETLRDYLALRQEYDQNEVSSDLVEAHLGPEVKRLQAAQKAISKLPLDLLTALANASDEQRQKLLAALK